MKFALALLCSLAIVLTNLRAAEVGIVSHIKVLSDKVEDVSSMEAWKKSFIKDGMTDEQKALAVWTTVVKFRHQDIPPIEFLTGDGGDVHDPIKTFNVYGYNMCCCESSNICALARYAGLKARGWGINAHSVPEIEYGGAWHLYDASLICFFKKSDGSVAGVEDILGDVSKWYEKNPDYRKNNDKLLKFMRDNGWNNGPSILANTSAYDQNGWLPAATHGWYSTMQEYDGRGGGKDNKAFLYEYGYSQGYEVNIQLRPGERITRNWSNKGLQINMDGSGAPPGCLTEKVGKYAAAMGDRAPGRIGYGIHDYAVPFENGSYRSGALLVENLEDGDESVHVKDPTKPGVLIVRMASPYVILNGVVAVGCITPEHGEIAVDVSVNNGQDWNEVKKVHEWANGLSLSKLIIRHYSYCVRFTLKGKGTGLKNVNFEDEVQLSQRALPAFDTGDNKITFSAGPDEGTVTIEANNAADNKGKQLTYADFHPVLDHVNKMLVLEAGAGSITFPIKTPGDMTRLRFGSFYRARDAKDGWDYQVSFDGGKTYKTIDHAAGLTGNGQCKYVTFAEIPPNTKEAFVRFAGQQRNTTMLSNFRIDADYKEPAGGFRPVKISYAWEEEGQPKQDVHIAKSAEDAYAIHCDKKPLMKSIVLELAE